MARTAGGGNIGPVEGDAGLLLFALASASVAGCIGSGVSMRSPAGVAVRGPADESGFACAVSTVSGETDCGFDAAEDGGTYTLGAGEAALRISTTSGNVELAPLA